MRTKYSLINIVAGVGGHLLNMVLSFVSRMVFIRYLAAAYLGVNGLFSDILGMLNLAGTGYRVGDDFQHVQARSGG